MRTYHEITHNLELGNYAHYLVAMRKYFTSLLSRRQVQKLGELALLPSKIKQVSTSEHLKKHGSKINKNIVSKHLEPSNMAQEGNI